MDLQWFPSNLHIHLHQSVNVLHPLETLCHVPFKLYGSAPLVVSPLEMSFVVLLAFAPLAMSNVELSFVVSL